MQIPIEVQRMWPTIMLIAQQPAGIIAYGNIDMNRVTQSGNITCSISIFVKSFLNVSIPFQIVKSGFCFFMIFREFWEISPNRKFFYIIFGTCLHDTININNSHFTMYGSASISLDLVIEIWRCALCHFKWDSHRYTDFCKLIITEKS